MKEQILKIAEQLKYDDITTDHAQSLLLGLFGVSGSLYHPDYGYSSPKELVEKGVSVYTGLTNKGHRITSWEYKMIDGRAYIANHLMQEGSVLLLNCPNAKYNRSRHT